MSRFYFGGYINQKSRVENNRNLFEFENEDEVIKNILSVASQYAKAMAEDDYISAKYRAEELSRSMKFLRLLNDNGLNIRLAMYIATTSNYDARKILLSELSLVIRQCDYKKIQEILSKQKSKSLAMKVDKFFTKFFPSYQRCKENSSNTTFNF